MIKNIPNKYTQAMLLDLLDKEFLGCYNFFYLPIDGSNGCNMGYAFINLTSNIYIPRFFEKFNSFKWPTFQSYKICRIN